MKTKFYSYKLGSLPKGCQLCVKGRKSVLFITGLCANHCYFCPISDKKKNKDVIFINERPVKREKDIIEEIKLCSSTGVGITGGDPLIRLQRVIKTVKLLKKKFGKSFHIHLYTPLKLIDEKKLKHLYKSGIDEIRFHPNLDKRIYWDRIKLAKKYKWDVGVEIPSIPGKEKQTKKLVDFLKEKIDFLNINELEISDTNAQNLVEQGFKPKNNISYGVKGSHELALKILRFCKGKIKRAHYCTTTLKDRVQLRKRILFRARNVKKEYDIITEDGMLFRGAIYCKKPEKIIKKIKKEYEIPKELIRLDKKNCRIITASWIVDELKEELKKKGLKIALIENYPTYDELEVMVDYM